jgi:hypothetical protein
MVKPKQVESNEAVLPSSHNENEPLQKGECLTAQEIVLDQALERWWDGMTDDAGFSLLNSLSCDRFHLLENLGCANPAKYCRWGWRSLPREIRLALVTFTVQGRPLEFLMSRQG